MTDRLTVRRRWNEALRDEWDRVLAQHRERMDERRQLGPYLTRAYGMTMLSDAGRKLLSESAEQ